MRQLSSDTLEAHLHLSTSILSNRMSLPLCCFLSCCVPEAYVLSRSVTLAVSDYMEFLSKLNVKRDTGQTGLYMDAALTWFYCLFFIPIPHSKESGKRFKMLLLSHLAWLQTSRLSK